MTLHQLRNAGFERGNTDHWRSEYATSFGATPTIKVYGSYGGQIEGIAEYGTILWHNDMIPVKAGSLIRASISVRGTYPHQCTFHLQKYDSDGKGIDSEQLAGCLLNDYWTELYNYYHVESEVKYVKIYLYYPTLPAGVYAYVDAADLVSLNAEDMLIDHIKLAEVVNETASHTVTLDEVFAGGWKEADYLLSISSFTGTNNKLDVQIISQNQKTLRTFTVATFEQMTGIGTQRIVLKEGLGWHNSVQYTTQGTITDLDFKVGAIYKR